jgi:hypothetical protein
MASHSLVIGYHGCDRRVVDAVVAEQADLKPSQNAWDWLGHGVYFWEDSQARALRWAETEAQRGRGSIGNPAVLGAVVQLGNCLDLIQTESLSLVKDAHQAYADLCVSSGSRPLKNRGPQFRARFLDCAVIETLHQLRLKERKQPFDTVRGFFLEGRELYSGAGFRELDHIQICVRSPKQIIGCFWSREA